MNLVPKAIRKAFERWQGRRLHGLIRRAHAHTSDPEIQEVLDYLSKHRDMVLPLNARPPYEFAAHFEQLPVDVVRGQSGFPVVIIDGHEIVFPRQFSDELVRKSVRYAMMEQCDGSPHQYITQNHQPIARKPAVLVGASDGIFALRTLKYTDYAYLFEPEPIWHEPLSITLGQYKDKFELIPKAAGLEDSTSCVRVDTVVGSTSIGFLEADTEGHEQEVLKGAEKALGSGSCAVSVCTYHRQCDAEMISGFLKQLGYAVRYSRGYFVMGYRHPYLRRAVVYGVRDDQ